jgi:hypothetical protein
MANGVSTSPPLKLQQALHGYSDGHRLLGSSIELAARDAKMMLMMSDASGPAAIISEDGYLTGYPLVESGHYAFARTWPAPEMPRPGCVWTHTILIDFSDIPALQSASGLLGLFRRPHGKDRGYDDALTFVHEESASAPPETAAARRILWAIYGSPSKSIVSSILEQRERDEFVLAMWDQQWPRLKRTFRFCTLSFADRSSGGNVFDLQFLPGSGRVPRAQFRTALDADRSEVEFFEWLDDAVSDLLDGPGGDLRRFLRAAGSDVSGREAFVPLASLHALSRHFATVPDSVERAILLLEERIPDSQGYAARALIARVAGAAAYNLSSPGLKFVVKHFDLIEDSEAAVLAENIGGALWTSDPGAVVDLLSDDSGRRQIAEHALSSLPLSALVKGAATVPHHRQALFDARPDLGTEIDYWSLPGAWTVASLRRAAEHTELAPAIIAAMARSERAPVRDVCEAFGRDTVLQRLLSLIDEGEALPLGAQRAWLAEACLEAGIVARLLCRESFAHASTLEILAHFVAPDFATNDVGDDPWLIAVRRTVKSSLTLYMAGFLLARALGRRTRNSADLVHLTFDRVYAATASSALPNDVWRLLDDRLYSSYFWPSWDRCRRIRQSTVDLFVNRNLDPQFFSTITQWDDVFARLVDVAAGSFRGQEYLKTVSDWLSQDGTQQERLLIIKRVMW